MQSLSFEIPLKPVAAARPRVSKRVVFYPPAYSNYKKAASYFVPRKKFDGAIEVEMTFYFPIPTKVKKKDRLSFEGAAHTSKPDIDNLVKAVMDLMNGKVVEDDAQIAKITAVKRLTNGTSCTVVEVKEFEM